MLSINRWTEIGKEWERIEGKKYGNDPRKIFKLEKEKGTLLSIMIDALIHIRNAISHPTGGGIYPTDETHFRVVDCKTNGEKSFDKVFPVSALWGFVYSINLMSRGLNAFSMLVIIYQDIIQLNKKNNRVIACPNCGAQMIKYIDTNSKNIKCSRCKRKLII
jgi:DNA-directed RNA polymerase subunit RPC12/RpoP